MEKKTTSRFDMRRLAHYVEHYEEYAAKPGWSPQTIPAELLIAFAAEHKRTFGTVGDYAFARDFKKMSEVIASCDVDGIDPVDAVRMYFGGYKSDLQSRPRSNIGFHKESGWNVTAFKTVLTAVKQMVRNGQPTAAKVAKEQFEFQRAWNAKRTPVHNPNCPNLLAAVALGLITANDARSFAAGFSFEHAHNSDCDSEDLEDFTYCDGWGRQYQVVRDAFDDWDLHRIETRCPACAKFIAELEDKGKI